MPINALLKTRPNQQPTSVLQHVCKAFRRLGPGGLAKLKLPSLFPRRPPSRQESDPSALPRAPTTAQGQVQPAAPKAPRPAKPPSRKAKRSEAQPWGQPAAQPSAPLRSAGHRPPAPGRRRPQRRHPRTESRAPPAALARGGTLLPRRLPPPSPNPPRGVPLPPHLLRPPQRAPRTHRWRRRRRLPSACCPRRGAARLGSGRLGAGPADRGGRRRAGRPSPLRAAAGRPCAPSKVRCPLLPSFLPSLPHALPWLFARLEAGAHLLGPGPALSGVPAGAVEKVPPASLGKWCVCQRIRQRGTWGTRRRLLLPLRLCI